MTEQKKINNRFDSALYAFCPETAKILRALPENIKVSAQEIRVRSGKPLMLTVAGAAMWVSKNGAVSYLPGGNPLIITASEVQQLYFDLCSKSVYSHTDEIKQGYIMMKSGHRAGVFGTLTPTMGLRDISSVNIRISREIFGCADKLTAHFDGGGMLIAGPPGCGKTTLLRDLVRQLSDGAGGTCRRISVIDSRGEIAASERGVPQNDIGANTDVITGAGKPAGIEMAVRTMFPQIVAFDEIGTSGEIEEIIKGLNAGVAVITTAHIGRPRDIMRRDVTRQLVKSGAITKVALLEKAGGSIDIAGVEEICAL